MYALDDCCVHEFVRWTSLSALDLISLYITIRRADKRCITIHTNTDSTSLDSLSVCVKSVTAPRDGVASSGLEAALDARRRFDALFVLAADA